MIARAFRDLSALRHTRLDLLEADLRSERLTESSSRIALREADDLAVGAGRRMQALRARAAAR